MRALLVAIAVMTVAGTASAADFGVPLDTFEQRLTSGKAIYTKFTCSEEGCQYFARDGGGNASIMALVTQNKSVRAVTVEFDAQNWAVMLEAFDHVQSALAIPDRLKLDAGDAVKAAATRKVVDRTISNSRIACKTNDWKGSYLMWCEPR